MTNSAVAGLGYIEAPALLAMVLAAGAAGGTAARFARLPKVVGYLLAGLVLQSVVTGYLQLRGLPAVEARHAAHRAAQPLEPLIDLALGLIVFSLGAVFDRRRLQRRILYANG